MLESDLRPISNPSNLQSDHSGQRVEAAVATTRVWGVQRGPRLASAQPSLASGIGSGARPDYQKPRHAANGSQRTALAGLVRKSRANLTLIAFSSICRSQGK